MESSLASYNTKTVMPASGSLAILILILIINTLMLNAESWICATDISPEAHNPIDFSNYYGTRK